MSSGVLDAPAGALEGGTIARRPIKVVHVVYALRMGGTEQGVVKLANGLRRAAVASAICSCQPAGALRERLDPDVPLYEFAKRDGNDPLFVLRLARLLRRRRPDIVHTHSWGTLCEGILAARLAGVPYVVHGEHGTMELRPRNRKVQRFAWERADCVLSVSSRLAENMARTVGYPLERIRVIRNGVDISRFAPARRQAARRMLQLAADEVAIGTVGRLVPVKDQAGLLKALAALRAQRVAFKAIIVGDGPLRGELAALARSLDLADHVLFLGERADVEDVLAAFDVFTLSSVSEGLSNTIMEAMATGVPVVATHVGGADELVDEARTGMLVPASDPAALASALQRLLRNEDERRSMGAAARVRAEHEFSLAAMLSSYETLYTSLAAPKALVDAPCVA